MIIGWIRGRKLINCPVVAGWFLVISCVWGWNMLKPPISISLRAGIIHKSIYQEKLMQSPRRELHGIHWLLVFRLKWLIPGSSKWDDWLVVWNMAFMTFHILGMSSSQLTNSYFSEGLKPPTRWILIHTNTIIISIINHSEIGVTGTNLAIERGPTLLLCLS